MTYKVAVLVGSLRENSYSAMLAQTLKELAMPALALDIIQIGDLPFYNPDLDDSNVPAPWTRFRNDIAGADAVLFVTPEYNRSYPAVLKNALDVGSRPYGKSVFNGKPTAIVSQSPGLIGGFGANHHLRQPLVFLNMPILQSEVYISKINELFDTTGKLNNEGTKEFLTSFVKSFTAWVALHAKK